MNNQARAILWAQFRATRNMLPRNGKLGTVLSVLINTVWYGLWCIAAVAVMMLVRESTDRSILASFLAQGLLLSFLYWQIIPVLMVTAGASLQMRRLRVYPIPHAQLFHLEVLLRMTTAIEMILLLLGATIGLFRNPTLPSWYAIAFVPYFLFNLYVSTGVRDVITRLLGWRRFREAMLIFVVMLAALPQIVLRSGIPKEYLAKFERFQMLPWPWTAAAHLVSGDWSLLNVAALLLWLGAAYAFGRWQFERGLRFDEEASRSRGNTSAGRDSLAARIFRLPSVLFSDPLGALIEKEVRSLVRSPRFRIVFLMGFTFGLMIWFPMAFRKGRGPDSMLQSNFLVIVSAYSIMLLSEVGIWNVFGFDRSAAQIYWLSPVPTHLAFIAKNIATAIFVTLEVVLISGICLLFRLPVTMSMFVQTLIVCMILLAFLMAIGNISSLRFPRPVDPNQNWKRSAASGFQAMLLLVYPFLSLPFLFAYYAKYKWESEWAFYLSLAITASFAAVAYGFSLERVIIRARTEKERLLSMLSQGSGPVSS